jgi:hypothetical protein
MRSGPDSFLSASKLSTALMIFAFLEPFQRNTIH